MRRIMIQSQPQANSYETLSQKFSAPKRAGRLAQAVEHLPSKRETLSLNHSTTKKEKSINIVTSLSNKSRVLTEAFKTI
jgi:hypothetical protein